MTAEQPEQLTLELVSEAGVHTIPLTAGKALDILSKLKPGEPVFIFRAKDILSTFALDEYARLIEKFAPMESEQLVSIVDATERFREWQRANPDKVKLPD